MKSLSKRMLHIGLLALGCAWMTSQLAFGQTLGSIAGEIHDATGAVVAGTNISVTSGIRTSDSDTLFSQDGRCMLCDRGLSAFDNRHRLVGSGLYDLPIGKGRKMNIQNNV